jgi:hypothetical protein
MFAVSACVVSAGGLERVKYNNPGLVVDLGVGLSAWPLPMDYDKDGDNDLVVSSGGMYFFENTSGDVKMPVFKPAVKIGTRGWADIHASYVNGEVRLLLWRKEIVRFYDKSTNFEKTSKIYHKKFGNHWKYCDYDGDGRDDLLLNDKNVDFYRNVSKKKGEYIFKNHGMVDERILAGHSTSPTVVDWDKDGVPDLLVGAEDGYLYYMKNPNMTK